MRETGRIRRLLGAPGGAGVVVGTVGVWCGAMLALPAPGADASTAAVRGVTGPMGPGLGNPNGHFYVPLAGRAANTGHPTHVIGNGRPASCTSAAVVRDVAAGGVITFNCGPKPVTIVIPGRPA